MIFRRISTYLLGLAAVVAVLSAQTGNGTINGTITDPTGAVVPGVKLTLTEQQTNISRNAVSSSLGTYYFAEVPPGPYTLVLEQAGFRKWEGTLTLKVGQSAQIDPKLEVGSLSDTVEVTSATPVITTEGMQVADVKDELQIHQLPLNGRNISTLFNLTPGVEGGAAPRTNGLKVGSTEILQDGISLVDRFGGGFERVQPARYSARVPHRNQRIERPLSAPGHRHAGHQERNQSASRFVV
jgi:hypothetical protein